jgi:hypothetical protein
LERSDIESPEITTLSQECWLVDKRKSGTSLANFRFETDDGNTARTFEIYIKDANHPQSLGG